jgi:S-DNA-T family DNA segregation ATPase FtsK/SpoIIIE
VVTIGIEDISGRPATLDLRHSHGLITGGPRSGKSTAIAAVERGLMERGEVYSIHASIDLSLVDQVADEVEHRSQVRAGEPLVLVIDDLDQLDDSVLSRLWSSVTACQSIRVVASIDIGAGTGYSVNPVLTMLRRSRRTLILQPDDPAEVLQLSGTRCDVRPGLDWVPGRGVLVVDRQATVVQVADGGSQSVRTPTVETYRCSIAC